MTCLRCEVLAGGIKVGCATGIFASRRMSATDPPECASHYRCTGMVKAAPSSCGTGSENPAPPKRWRSLWAIRFTGDLRKHGVVSGFGRGGRVQREGRAARAMRVEADPRVFIGESPGLNCSAAWILQARPHHTTVHLSLAKKVVVPHMSPLKKKIGACESALRAERFLVISATQVQPRKLLREEIVVATYRSLILIYTDDCETVI